MTCRAVAPQLHGSQIIHKTRGGGFNSAALIITAAGLPRHAAMGLYFCNVLVPKRWIMRRLRAEGCVFWRWDDDLDRLTEAGLEQVISWCAVVSAVPKKPADRCINLVEKPEQNGCIPNII